MFNNEYTIDDTLFSSSPQLSLKETFGFGSLDSSRLPEDLALAGKHLLDKVETLGLTKAFRLELNPNEDSSIWSMSIRLHPVIWFDYFHRKKNDSTFIKIARNWIQTEREALSEIDLPDPPNTTVPENQRYCLYPATCLGKEKKTSCNYGKHASTFCEEQLLRKNGIKERCNWFAREELLLTQFSNSTPYAGQWLVTARYISLLSF